MAAVSNKSYFIIIVVFVYFTRKTLIASIQMNNCNDVIVLIAAREKLMRAIKGKTIRK